MTVPPGVLTRAINVPPGVIALAGGWDGVCDRTGAALGVCDRGGDEAEGFFV